MIDFKDIELFFNDKAGQFCAVSTGSFYSCTPHRAKREFPVEQFLMSRLVSLDDFRSEQLSSVTENRTNVNIQVRTDT